MGNEFAQGREWNYKESLDWYLLDEQHGGSWHKGVLKFVKDLNHTYTGNAPLYELDFDPNGFEWLVVDDAQNSVFAFERRSRKGERIIVISNFTPIPRENYRIGVNESGEYEEILNSDSSFYQGSNMGNGGKVLSEEIESHGKSQSINVVIPPLATIYLKFKAQAVESKKRFAKKVKAQSHKKQK